MTTSFSQIAKKWFNTSCDRKQIEDTSIFDPRKSEPLYRDLTKSASLIRAKYLTGPQQTVVDYKMVAMSMVEDGSKGQCTKLCECNFVRSAIGRGGEILYLRYKGARFDHFFHAFDMDWPLIKQTDQQCMLYFCDREDYQLCVYFGLAVYWLHGGLRCDGVDEAISSYVFPHLFSKAKKKVAERVTDALQYHIKRVLTNNCKEEKLRDKKIPQLSAAEKKDIESVAKRTTSRSLRKADMTENRAKRELSTQEEYARRGHAILRLK